MRKEVKRRLPESLNLSLVRSIPIDGEVLTRTDFESYTMLRQLEPEEYNTWSDERPDHLHRRHPRIV